MFVERVENGGIGSHIAGQKHRVINGDEHLRAGDDAGSGTQFRDKLIFIPKREIVMRHLSDLSAGEGVESRAADDRAGGSRIRNKRIPVRITAQRIPFRRDIAVQTNFKTIRPLTARLNDRRRIIRINRARVGAIQAIQCRCQLQRAANIPFDTERKF